MVLVARRLVVGLQETPERRWKGFVNSGNTTIITTAHKNPKRAVRAALKEAEDILCPENPHLSSEDREHIEQFTAGGAEHGITGPPGKD